MTRALCHNTRGRRQDAIDTARVGVEVDPLGVGTRIWFLAIVFNSREYDLQIAEATHLIDEQPAYSEAYRWRAMGRIMRGDLSLARADLEKAASLAPTHVWWDTNVALLSSQEGNSAETRQVRDDLLRRSKTEWVSFVALGQVEQSLGDYDAALAWYERAYQSRDFLMTVSHTDPCFSVAPPGKPESISDDPRWMNIVRRVGLAP